MNKPIGFYTVSPTAKAIEAEFGSHLKALSTEQIRSAIALLASPSFELFTDIKVSLDELHPDHANWQLIEMIRQASQDERLNLLPFFVDVLRSR